MLCNYYLKLYVSLQSGKPSRKLISMLIMMYSIVENDYRRRNTTSFIACDCFGILKNIIFQYLAIGTFLLNTISLDLLNRETQESVYIFQNMFLDIKTKIYQSNQSIHCQGVELKGTTCGHLRSAGLKCETVGYHQVIAKSLLSTTQQQLKISVL